MSLKCLISIRVAASFHSSGMKSPPPLWLAMPAIAAALSMMLLYDWSGAGLGTGVATWSVFGRGGMYEARFYLGWRGEWK